MWRLRWNCHLYFVFCCGFNWYLSEFFFSQFRKFLFGCFFLLCEYCQWITSFFCLFQFTSVMIHHQKQKYLMDSFLSSYSLLDNSQDSTTNERLPEENVSIIETLEGRDDNLDDLGTPTTGTTRKKLYFNPAYFEPQLLLVRIYYFTSPTFNKLLFKYYWLWHQNFI